MDRIDIPFLCDNARLTLHGRLALLGACFPEGLSLESACAALHVEKEALTSLPERYFLSRDAEERIWVREKALTPVLHALAAMADNSHDSLSLWLAIAFHLNDGEALQQACQSVTHAFASSLSLVEKKVVASVLIFVLTKRRFILKDIAGCGRLVSLITNISPHLLSYGELGHFKTLLFKAKGLAFVIGNDKAYSFLHFAIQCVKIPLDYAHGKNFDLHALEESFWQLKKFHDSSLRLIALPFLSIFYIFTGKYFNVINIWRLNIFLDSDNMPQDCVIIENAFIGAMMTCQYSLALDIASAVNMPSSLPLRDIARLYCEGWSRRIPQENLENCPPSPMLALAWFLSGEFRLAAETLGEISLGAEHFLRYPFLPELLFQLDQKRFRVFSDQQWTDELRRARIAPNTILRGIFLRISADRMAVSPERDDKDILSSFQHSLNILQGGLAPLETARTCLAMSRFMKMTGRSAEGGPFERKAAEIIGCLFPPLWPSEKKLPSLPGASAATPYFPYILIFQALLELNCRQLVKSTPLLFSGILSAFMTAFGALQGYVVQEKERKKECIASSGSHEDRTGDEEMTDVDFFRILEKDESSGMSRILLKVTYDEKESFLLSISGPFSRSLLQILDRNMCELLTRQILSEIRNYQRTQQTHSHSLLRSSVHMAQPGAGAVFFRSAEMKKLMKTIDLLAPTEASVLLIGESGVGKERLARRIHELSGRSGEFIPVNLSSIPSSLFESECLGYEKGSFTGAAGPKKGLFELADNGTLFLDEVADIPMDVQVKLLRVLQERTFRHVGGLKPIHSRFRLVSATNFNLEKAVAEGRLRSDLYFRLNTISLAVPPLRKRRGDILFLADIFLAQFCQQYGKKKHVLSDEETARLLAMPWPGNVRELMHFMERLAILDDFQLAKATGCVEANESSPMESRKPSLEIPSREPVSEEALFQEKEIVSMAELEAKYFTFVYRQKKGRVTGKNGVAQALGISDHTAFNWIRKLKLVR